MTIYQKSLYSDGQQFKPISTKQTTVSYP